MDLVCFEIGSERFPVYRGLRPREGRTLRALLGPGFRIPLSDTEPLDTSLVDILKSLRARLDFFFVPPAGANLLGTFELRHGSVPDLGGAAHPLSPPGAPRPVRLPGPAARRQPEPLRFPLVRSRGERPRPSSRAENPSRL